MAKRSRVKSEVTVLRTTEVQSIANELLDTAQLAVQRAIAQFEDPNPEHFPSRRDSLEEIILKRLKTANPEAQKRAMLNIKIQRAVAIRGRTDKIKTTKPIPAFEQLRKLPAVAKLSQDTLAREGFEGLGILSNSKGSTPDFDFDGALKNETNAIVTLYRELELRVYKLECVRVTDGVFDDGGEDEISLDGIALTANGTTKNLSTLIDEVSFHHSDYGDADVFKVKAFDPPKVFAKFKFKEIGRAHV